MEFLKWNRKILIILMLAFVALAGCEYEDEDDDSDDPTVVDTSTPTTDVDVVEFSTTISGVVAEGLALANVVVTFTDANGTVHNDGSCTTDASGTYDCTLTDSTKAIAYPVEVSVTDSNGDTIRGLVADEPAAGEKAVAQVNPITNAVVSSLLDAGTSLSDITTAAFNTAGNAVTEAVFGTGVEFSLFTSDFKARTDANTDTADSVSLGDALLDLISAANTDLSLISVSLDGTVSGQSDKLLEDSTNSLIFSNIVGKLFTDPSTTLANSIPNATKIEGLKSAADSLKDNTISIEEAVAAAILMANNNITVDTPSADLETAKSKAKEVLADSVDKIKENGIAAINNIFIDAGTDLEGLNLTDASFDATTAKAKLKEVADSFDPKAKQYFSVSGNSVSITKSDSSETVSLGTDGTVGTFELTENELNSESPKMTVALVSGARVGDYVSNIGLMISDDNTDRMIKAILTAVKLVKGETSTYAVVGEASRLHVSATDMTGTSVLSGVFKNEIANGPITTDNEGNLTFDPNALKSKILEKIGSITDQVYLPGSYSYKIYLETGDATLSTVTVTEGENVYEELTSKTDAKWSVGAVSLKAGSYVLNGKFTVAE